MNPSGLRPSHSPRRVVASPSGMLRTAGTAGIAEAAKANGSFVTFEERQPSPLAALLQPPSTASANKVPVLRFDTADEVSRAVAERIAQRIRANHSRGEWTVLGLATGGTPVGVYRELIRMHREEGLDFSRVKTFNLDEYLGLSPEDENSYHRYMFENLFDHVNIDPANVHLPPGNLPVEEIPAACAAYEQAIEDAGGIQLQLLGTGINAHIGFNEPGSAVQTRTRLIELAPETRERAVNEFGALDAVPSHAITMGIGTILGASEILLMATGANKAEAVQRSVQGPINEEVPGSFLQRHANVRFYVDASAASALDQA